MTKLGLLIRTPTTISGEVVVMVAGHADPDHCVELLHGLVGQPAVVVPGTDFLRVRAGEARPLKTWQAPKTTRRWPICKPGRPPGDLPRAPTMKCGSWVRVRLKYEVFTPCDSKMDAAAAWLDRGAIARGPAS